MSQDKLLATWRACLSEALVEAVEHGPDAVARPGPNGLTASEARTALGRRRAVLPPRALVDALVLPGEPVPSFRVTVPVRNRDDELYGLDFQVSNGSGMWATRLLRVLRVEEAEFADLFAHADELAATRVRARPEPPALPAEPRAPGTAEGTSVRLRAAEAASVRSRLAGVPFAPDEFEWPRRGSGRPLAFLAQIDLRELPATRALPADGTLAFFYDAETEPWGSEPGDDDGWQVHYWPGSEPLSVTQPPDDLEPVELAPQQGLEAADGGEPVARMLGEPDAIQDDPREGDWLLLMQFDSGDPFDLDFYDAGRLYFMIAPPDLAARRFDRVHLRLQCY